MKQDKQGDWICEVCGNYMTSSDYGYYCDNRVCKEHDKDYEITDKEV